MSKSGPVSRRRASHSWSVIASQARTQTSRHSAASSESQRLTGRSTSYRSGQHDDSGAVEQIAEDAESEQRQVRENSSRSLGGIAGHDQSIVDAEIDVDHGREREQIRDAGGSGGALLRIGDEKVGHADLAGRGGSEHNTAIPRREFQRARVRSHAVIDSPLDSSRLPG